MKKLMLIFVLSNFLNLSAQYSITPLVGKETFMFDFRGLASQLMLPPLNNKLSNWRDLPFKWNFFGKEVQGYYISDNGYITFNKNATMSIKDRRYPLDFMSPTNSIFAFWTDLYLQQGNPNWTNTIATATIGVYPNRVHVIYWMGVVPIGSIYANDALSFAIAIYEKGDFDIIYTVRKVSYEQIGTVGCTNEDGSMAVQVGLPQKNGLFFPDVQFGDLDDLYIVFSYEGNTYVKEMKTNDLSLSPNPASYYINVTSDLDMQEIPESYSIFNSSGICVLTSQENNNKEFKRIDVSSLSSGKYFIMLYIKDRIYIKNFIKN